MWGCSISDWRTGKPLGLFDFYFRKLLLVFKMQLGCIDSWCWVVQETYMSVELRERLDKMKTEEEQ